MAQQVSEARLLDLVDSIYAAGLEPELWSKTLDQLSQTLNLAAASLLFADRDDLNTSIVANVGTDPDVVEAYNTDYLHRDPTVIASQKAPVGTLISSEEILTQVEWKRTALYNDLMRPAGLCYIMGSTLLLEQDSYAAIGLQRLERLGPFDSSDYHAYKLLQPHFQRALAVHRQINGAQIRANRMEEAWDHFSVGAMVLSADGRLLEANREARRILEEDDGLAISRGELVCGRAAQTSRLRQLVASVLTEQRLSGGGALRIERPSFKLDYEVLAVPMTSPHERAGSTAMLYVTDPELSLAPPLELLVQMYALTPAEADLCLQILQGSSLTEIAEGREVSKETIRTQLKAVFQKTETNRQSELMRKLLTGPLRYLLDPCE